MGSSMPWGGDGRLGEVIRVVSGIEISVHPAQILCGFSDTVDRQTLPKRKQSEYSGRALPHKPSQILHRRWSVGQLDP